MLHSALRNDYTCANTVNTAVLTCANTATTAALQEPFLAIVVDPVRTMASGKVEIGAFRTYPEGYKWVGGGT